MSTVSSYSMLLLACKIWLLSPVYCDKTTEARITQFLLESSEVSQHLAWMAFAVGLRDVEVGGCISDMVQHRTSLYIWAFDLYRSP